MTILPTKSGTYLAYFLGKLRTMEQVTRVKEDRFTFTILKVFDDDQNYDTTPTEVGRDMLEGWEYLELGELGKILYE